MFLAAGDGGDEDDFVVGLDGLAPVAEVAVAGAAEGVELEAKTVAEREFVVESGGGAGEGFDFFFVDAAFFAELGEVEDFDGFVRDALGEFREGFVEVGRVVGVV